MIDFEEELKKFKIAPEVDMAEQIIRENAMADLKDVIANAARLSRAEAESTEKTQED